mgnify:CR=1 FL=1
MAKTKRYAFSRLRRMVWCAFLDLTAQEAAAPPAYLRVLAFSDRGRAVLSLARKQARLPLVTKPAHGRQLPPAARQAFEKEALRTRLSQGKNGPRALITTGRKRRLLLIINKGPAVSRGAAKSS